MVSGIALIGTVPTMFRPLASNPSCKNATRGLVSKFVIVSVGSSKKSLRSRSKSWPGITVRDGMTITKKSWT